MEPRDLTTQTQGGHLAHLGDEPDFEAQTRRLAQFKQFVKTQMKEGVDFGLVPGAKQRSLWKAGAEKALTFHGYSSRSIIIESQTVVDWKTPFFNYAYRTEIINRRGEVIATCDGSCNSAEYDWVLEQKTPGDLRKHVNSMQKKAQKRSFVGAALIACRASDDFTHDTDEEAEEKSSGKPAGAKAGGGDKAKDLPDGAISEGKVKLIYARLKEAGKTKEQFCEAFGIPSIEHLHYKKFEDAVKWIATEQ